MNREKSLDSNESGAQPQSAQSITRGRRIIRVEPQRELELHKDKNLIREVVEASTEAAARALLKSLFGRLNKQ